MPVSQATPTIAKNKKYDANFQSTFTRAKPPKETARARSSLADPFLELSPLNPPPQAPDAPKSRSCTLALSPREEKRTHKESLRARSLPRAALHASCSGWVITVRQRVKMLRRVGGRETRKDDV